MTDEKFDSLCLTNDQKKAANEVFAAMKKAHKLGVAFWDNYGTLTAFNAKKIGLPTPDILSRRGGKHSLNESDVSYHKAVPNFYAGNADDELIYEEL